MPALADLLALLTPAERDRLDALLAPAVPFPPLGEWLARARPQYRWDYPHFRHLQAALYRVTAGHLRRVYLQLPIRHGKTEHNAVGYAAYRLERDPACRVLVCSYNQRRAEKFSRDIRRLVQSRGVPLSREKDGAGEWETAAGGGVQAVGAGAGVAGVKADLILVDDPIGSRDDAESGAVCERVWDWLTNDILARCEPHTAVLLTMSRWHADDPAGRLLDGQPAEAGTTTRRPHLGRSGRGVMPRLNLRDTDLHYEEHGTGPEAVVFAHGLLLSGRQFDGQVEALRNDFRCVTYDARGHGQSGSPPGGYDLDGQTEDAADLIRQLGCGPCHFVGFSMGGFVGQRLAARHPQLLRSLTLIG